MRNRRILTTTLLATSLFYLASTPGISQIENIPSSAEGWLHLAVDRICVATPLDALSVQQELPRTWLLEENISPPGRPFNRLTQRFALPDGELRISRIDVNGQLRRFTAEIYKTNDNSEVVPAIQVLADGTCTPRSSRRVRQVNSDTVILEQLDADLMTLLWTETLQAPWPSGKDPGGPRIALIDSGLAYDLPVFINQLARDSTGKPLGFDYWDLDPLPYDGDTSRNAFQPIRHGTPVASIIAREAPTAALIPFRYPRPDMDRMDDVIRQIAETPDARIISMPLGSANPKEWQAFETSMRAYPNLLAIVSAGNNGRDIDTQPLWPSALKLSNVIVVTSSDALGRLAEGSNWGAESVHLMVPGENQPVIDFRGAKGRASGTSYAVPRIAALAARILIREPDLTTDQLKARIFARAIPPRYNEKIVSIGWIIDPEHD